MDLNIIARNIHIRINGREIIRNISIFFRGPGIFFIIGKNGSGKSTLLRALAGLIPFEGEIKINGKPIGEYSRKQLARIIGYVWQNPLYGFFEENVKREICFILKNLRLPLENMDRIVDMFKIKNLLERSPFFLSGGEAKRVSISSVIVADQPIILFDEPESEMDMAGLVSILNYIRENSSEKLMIIATHNPLLAVKLKDVLKEIYYIKDGQIVRKGGSETLNDYEFLASISVVPPSWWFD